MKRLNQMLMGVITGLFTLGTPSAMAQGDQILDGIGETDMMARYIFDGNIKDWSRNTLHGNIEGSAYKFEEDANFGQVLSLTGNDQTYLSLPAKSVLDQESLSLSGWFNLRSDKNGQTLFDFGKNAQSHMYASVSDKTLKAEVVSKRATYTCSIPTPELNAWVHLAVVIDVPAKTLRTYINGKLVKETTDMDLELAQLFDSSLEKNSFYMGKSLTSDNTPLDALLHDFRVYRIPLNAKQVSNIYKNALGLNKEAEAKEENHDGLFQFPESTPQLYNAYLTAVPDIEVETVVGYLPRLPRFVKGEYSNNIEGQEVRVLWPAPNDNSPVLKAGTYTITGKVAGTGFEPKAVITVKDAPAATTPERSLEGFQLNEVTLNLDAHQHDTKFIENRDKFIKELAISNPDDFLYMFRNAFGQEQPEGAKPLTVWDSQETKLRGHATGHYLSAIAQAYASTAYDADLQQKFADKMEYMVNTLYELSQLSGQPTTPGGEAVSDPTAVPPGPRKSEYTSDLTVDGIRTDYQNWGVGFISAYPPDQFIMLESGAKYGTDNSRIWAPYYTLHKILAGLMDVYEVSGNEKALTVVEGMGDWVYARLSQLSTETLITMWNLYIAGEFGGMNEAMARLSRLSDEPRYMEAAKLFDNIKMFYGNAEHDHGLAKNVDMFRGLHANQHIPQIMGALEIYRDSDAPEYYHIADNFWTKATGDYMYSIGGVAGAHNPSNAECFTAQPATLYENGLSSGGQNETCATYNMLKLSRNLFMFNENPELMDYYERGLYNHILASVAEHSPANTYHVPLRPGSEKHFSNDDMSGFTCCNGTALESNTKLQNSIYFKSADNSALYVNLYVPSTLNWTDKKVSVTQTTAFPKEDHTTLTINGKGKFDLKVRVPHWATKGFFVTINGEEQKVEAQPGTYLTLSRKWKKGDTVELRMPFHFYLEPIMDQQNIASLFYGPVLLAAQESSPRADWRKVTFNAHDISKAITGDPEKLEFTIDGVEFKPFYETYGRHSVYLDVTLKE